MKHVSLSRDGTRLTLTVKDMTALRAAALSIRGARSEGTASGLAVFSYPALPDTWRDLRDAFQPTLDERARPLTDRLERQESAVAGAVERKGSGEPLLFDPGLRYQPMAHQCEAMNFAWRLMVSGEQGGGAYLMEQGTGKSLCAIGLANGLAYSHPETPAADAGSIGWALVLCPNSLKGTWGAEDGEVHKHSDPALGPPAVHVLRGSRARRLKQLRQLLAVDWSPSLLWVVTNYEQLQVDPRKSKEFQQLLAIVREGPPGLLVCDESTALKNPRAKRTRAVTELARLFPYKLILTGTPVTRAPLDVYSQFEVLDKGALGFATYLGFERAYAVTERRHLGGRTFHEVKEYRNLDDLERRVARLSYRVRAADCLDLPPVVVQHVPVELSPEQGRMLRQLRDDFMGELEGGAALDGRNILTRYLRMAEVAGGFPHVLGPDGRPAGVKALQPNPKLEAARDYLELVLDDPEHKAVVFAQFRAEVEALAKLAEQRGWQPAVFHGDVAESERDYGRQRFQTSPDCRVLVAQYQTGSHGLNLTAANFLLFYSLTFSLEHYLQARKRVHRHGQTRTVNEAYLLARRPAARGSKTYPTLDHTMLSALDGKLKLADMVTGDAAHRVLGAL